MGESEDPDVSEKSQRHFPIAKGIITIARSHHVPYAKIFFNVYIYYLIRGLDISKDCIKHATKRKSKKTCELCKYSYDGFRSRRRRSGI